MSVDAADLDLYGAPATPAAAPAGEWERLRAEDGRRRLALLEDALGMTLEEIVDGGPAAEDRAVRVAWLATHDDDTVELLADVIRNAISRATLRTAIRVGGES